MKIKIIGSIVFILMMIASVLPVAGTIKNVDSTSMDVTTLPTEENKGYNNYSSKNCDCNSPTSDECFRVTVIYLNLLWVNVKITNLCNETQFAVPWTITINGGLFTEYNYSTSGYIDALQDSIIIHNKFAFIVGFFELTVKVDDCTPMHFLGVALPFIIFVFPSPPSP